MSLSLWEKIKATGEQLSPAGVNHRLVRVQGVPLQLCGSTRVQLQIDGLQKVYPVEVLVAKSITSDVILGRDFPQENQCNVNLDRKYNQLHFTAEKATVNLGHNQERNTIASVGVSVDESIQIPPRSELEMMVKVPPISTSTTSTWLVEPNRGERDAAIVARAMVNPEAGEIPIRILNPRPETVTVPKEPQ